MLHAANTADRPALVDCTDEELALRAQEGSAAAFALLVDRFETRLYSFILRRVRNHADAEDLTQEAFTRAWSCIRRYRSAWRFSTWLYTIASRACVNHLRRAGVRKRADHHAIAASDDGAVAPDAPAEAEETRAEVWAAAQESLTDAQFTALWLRYAEDLSMRDIGRVLGKSSVGVRALLFRARTALIEQMDPPDGDAEGTTRMAPSHNERAGAHRLTQERGRVVAPLVEQV